MVKRFSKKEIIERLERIENNQKLSYLHDWYVLGMTIFLAGAAFSMAGFFNPGIGLLIIGAGLIFIFSLSRWKKEKEFNKK